MRTNYLNAILPDILRSSEPMALVMDDTKRGTIRHFSILWIITENKCFYSRLNVCLRFNIYRKNKSPGYWMYIISRFVHSVSAVFFSSRPAAVPPKTPTIVRMVRMFSRTKRPNFDGMTATGWLRWGSKRTTKKYWEQYLFLITKWISFCVRKYQYWY